MHHSVNTWLDSASSFHQWKRACCELSIIDTVSGCRILCELSCDYYYYIVSWLGRQLNSTRYTLVCCYIHAYKYLYYLYYYRSRVKKLLYNYILVYLFIYYTVRMIRKRCYYNLLLGISLCQNEIISDCVNKVVVVYRNQINQRKNICSP